MSSILILVTLSRPVFLAKSEKRIQFYRNHGEFTFFSQRRFTAPSLFLIYKSVMCMLYILRLTEAPNGAAQLRPGATKKVFAGIMLFSTIPYGLRPRNLAKKTGREKITKKRIELMGDAYFLV